MRWFALGLSIFFLAALSAPSTTHAFTSNCTGGTIDTATQPGTTTHTFSAIGTSTLDCTGTGGGLVYALIVAGGGGGDAGGGGGGGVIASSSFMLPASSVTVAVGNGGKGRDNSVGFNALLGSSSSLCSNCGYSNSFVYAVGGGATIGGTTGLSGGSGSGGGFAGTGGAGTSGQGNAGGNGDSGSPFNGAGGGGASAVGQNASVGCAHCAGAGGNGIFNSITGSTTSKYGGGGGGSADNTFADSTGGLGGTGGGGGGGNATGVRTGVSGLTKTGGGGGGGSNGNLDGDGGSGIVVVAYATPTAAGTPTNNDGSQWFMLLFAIPIVPAVRRRYIIAAIFCAAILGLLFSYHTVHKKPRAGGIGITVSAITGTGRTPYYAHVVNGVVVNKLLDPTGMIPRGALGPPSEWILTDADVGNTDFTYDKLSDTFTDTRIKFVQPVFTNSTSTP